jgi:hypothetical protein
MLYLHVFKTQLLTFTQLMASITCSHCASNVTHCIYRTPMDSFQLNKHLNDDLINYNTTPFCVNVLFIAFDISNSHQLICIKKIYLNRRGEGLNEIILDSNHHLACILLCVPVFFHLHE